MSDWMAELEKVAKPYLGEDMWILQVFMVVLATAIVSYILRKFLAKLVIKAEETASVWDDVLINSAKRPAQLLVWIVGLLWAVEITKAIADISIFAVIDPARELAVIFLISWTLVRFIKEAEEVVRDPKIFRKPMDKTTSLAIGKLLRVSVMVTAVLVALQTLDFSVSGVLAFGGIGGIAVGFAAKDLLANFFGGLMIYLDRPFTVGDWIRSPDKNIEGTVEDIGWRLTRIRTFDKRPLYVPNATFASISVENPSRMTNRRIYETFGIRYDDTQQIQKIVDGVKEMLKAHPDIDTRQTMIVNLNAFAAYSVDFFVYTFTKTTDWIAFHEIKQDILMQILKVIEENGAELAFPTQTLHMAENKETPIIEAD